MPILPNSEQININKKYFQTEISSSNLQDLNYKKKIKPAFCQYPIDEDKVDKLIEIYTDKNGHYLHELRKEITFAVYEGENNEYEYFNIDGQHRMNMGIKIWEKEKKDLNFIAKFLYCNTMNEILDIFWELNYSDNRPKPPLSNNENFIWDIRNVLTNKYSQYFAKNLRKHSHIYTISEFISNLQQVNVEKYFEDKKYEDVETFIEKIRESNKVFNSKVNEHGYTQLKNNHTPTNKIFYVDELEILEKTEPITFGFMRNNFLFRKTEDNLVKRGWFFRKQTNIPKHNIIKKRQMITQEMKKKIWEKEYEDICDSDDDVFKLNPKCPVYKCKSRINFDTFESGHIKSVANGGTSNISNLRPICRLCNQKMSDTNWIDYERDIKKELKNNG